MLFLTLIDFFSFFFFFQAEDGIRDLTVTGVQTCALPISGEEISNSGSGPARQAGPIRFRGDRQRALAYRTDNTRATLAGADGQHLATLGRSEERRVGKECRSRWSPYH